MTQNDYVAKKSNDSKDPLENVVNLAYQVSDGYKYNEQSSWRLKNRYNNLSRLCEEVDRDLSFPYGREQLEYLRDNLRSIRNKVDSKNKQFNKHKSRIESVEKGLAEPDKNYQYSKDVVSSYKKSAVKARRLERKLDELISSYDNSESLEANDEARQPSSMTVYNSLCGFNDKARMLEAQEGTYQGEQSLEKPVDKNGNLMFRFMSDSSVLGRKKKVYSELSKVDENRNTLFDFMMDPSILRKRNEILEELLPSKYADKEEKDESTLTEPLSMSKLKPSHIGRIKKSVLRSVASLSVIGSTLIGSTLGLANYEGPANFSGEQVDKNTITYTEDVPLADETSPLVDDKLTKSYAEDRVSVNIPVKGLGKDEVEKSLTDIVEDTCVSRDKIVVKEEVNKDKIVEEDYSLTSKAEKEVVEKLGKHKDTNYTIEDDLKEAEDFSSESQIENKRGIYRQHVDFRNLQLRDTTGDGVSNDVSANPRYLGRSLRNHCNTYGEALSDKENLGYREGKTKSRLRNIGRMLVAPIDSALGIVSGGRWGLHEDNIEARKDNNFVLGSIMSLYDGVQSVARGVVDTPDLVLGGVTDKIIYDAVGGGVRGTINSVVDIGNYALAVPIDGLQRFENWSLKNQGKLSMELYELATTLTRFTGNVILHEAPFDGEYVQVRDEFGNQAIISKGQTGATLESITALLLDSGLLYKSRSCSSKKSSESADVSPGPSPGNIPIGGGSSKSPGIGGN